MANDVELYCLEVGKPINGVLVRIFTPWRFFYSFGFSPKLLASLVFNSKKVDIIHQHSLWTMGNICIGFLGNGAKLVTSPHGTLSTHALNFRWLQKKLLWPLQKRGLERSHLIHATSLLELNQIRSLGFTAPIALIPLGVFLPEILTLENKRNESNSRTLLFLSRLHPIKGIEKLFDAWKVLEKRHPSWRLVVAGDGDVDYVSQLHEKIRSLALKRVKFKGALFGAEKDLAFQTASLFVLPSYSENFGLVVAEALANGCPVVVSHGAPWSEIEREKCGWWVSNNIAELINSLDIAMSLPENDLREMGLRGRTWMARDYSWSVSSMKMNAAYKWIVDGGPQPDFINIK